jgi:hypothetical protein
MRVRGVGLSDFQESINARVTRGPPAHILYRLWFGVWRSGERQQIAASSGGIRVTAMAE